MIRYAITIFLSAFLLFQIQPMIARFILPWFGGAAAVWTACMMFFQFTLLLGYAYAHLLRWQLSPRNAWLLHTVVLIGAALFANITPAESLQPAGDENLTWAIVRLLIFTIGLPFFVLSTTGPLIQAWQSCSHADRSPYRLYALSNLGSMLALLSYPFLIERFFPLPLQTRIWSIMFLVFCIFCWWSGLQTARRPNWGAAPVEDRESSSDTATQLPRYQPLVWIILAMAASVMLLATTNLMCQEIASIPFLWILPLSLYLLSFIICFDRPHWYQRRIFTPLLALSSVAAVAIVFFSVYAGLPIQIAGLSTVCFAASMTCHGELERLKPQPKQLTWFFLLVSVGGALGGLFVGLGAPHLFVGFYEFQIALLICLFVPLAILFFEPRDSLNRARVVWGRWLMIVIVLVAETVVLGSLLIYVTPSFQPHVIYRARNEYGLVSVTDRGERLVFVNGRIEHGAQFKDPQRSMEHNSYYVPGTGVELGIEGFRDFLRAEKQDRGLLVGVIGLGAGGMMTWSKPGDQFVFFEINPEVERIAKHYFTYLRDSAGASEIVLGDGRLQLERRAKWLTTGSDPKAANPRAGSDRPTYSETRREPFDLLFVDAFSSDSIPLHLLTAECFDVYRANLKSTGVLIVHISNRFLDLQPVVHQAAIELGMIPLLIHTKPQGDMRPSLWVVITNNEAILKSDWVNKLQSPWPEKMPQVRWTDDRASLAEVLNWSDGVDWKSIRRQFQTE